MKKEMKYDPEDIESLLMHKEFSELYPEEREFVLRHIESPAEYASLRKTLHEVIEAGKGDKWLEPEPEIREHLLAQFAKEDRGGFAIWLNSLFAAPNVSWYRKPSFQLAFGAVAVLVVAGILYFRRPAEQVELIAQNTPATEKANEPATSAVDANTDKIDEKLIAENLNAPEPAGVPPVPAPAVNQIKFTTIEVTDEVEEYVGEKTYNADMSLEEAFETESPVEAVPEMAEPASTSGFATPKTNQGLLDSYSKKESKDMEKSLIRDQAASSLGEMVETEAMFKTSTNSVSLSEMPDLFGILYTAP